MLSISRITGRIKRHTFYRLQNLAYSHTEGRRHRAYSTLPFNDVASNQVRTRVKLGIGRSIDLKYVLLITHNQRLTLKVCSFRIIYPPRPERNGPIILDLGRGISISTAKDPTRELSLSSNATLVQPLYDVASSYKYPAPIHMVWAK